MTGEVGALERRALRLLSVVAPMCNEGSGVNAFVDRTRAALHDVPFELIVVDDGSTDDTLARLRLAATDDPRVRVVSAVAQLRPPDGADGRARARARRRRRDASTATCRTRPS